VRILNAGIKERQVAYVAANPASSRELDEGQVSEVIRDLRNNFPLAIKMCLRNAALPRGSNRPTRETGAATILLDRQSGRSTIETIHEVGLKQFCARFNTWVEQSSQP